MDPNGQLMDIGTVAAANIARALELEESKVPVIREAIRDEISAMSSHFTLAFGDIQTAQEVALKKVEDENAAVHAQLRENSDALRKQYSANVVKLRSDFDATVKEIRSTFTFVKAYPVQLSTVGVAVFLFGVLAALLIR